VSEDRRGEQAVLDGKGAIALQADGGDHGEAARGKDRLFERAERLRLEEKRGDRLPFGGTQFGKQKAVEDLDGGENVKPVGRGKKNRLNTGPVLFRISGFERRRLGNDARSIVCLDFDRGGLGGCSRSLGGSDQRLGGKQRQGAGNHCQGTGAKQA